VGVDLTGEVTALMPLQLTPPTGEDIMVLGPAPRTPTLPKGNAVAREGLTRSQVRPLQLTSPQFSVALLGVVLRGLRLQATLCKKKAFPNQLVMSPLSKKVEIE
jgi:hypothetical protein